mmetsp:Transcript_37052/g.85651  ORF Transcript_37052/g.85651 Transcript_37052/m.85651 type:complete len:144 (-) Transcript_37052:254-685(-)
MKLQRILLRWAPAGLGLEYLEEDGTVAVLHKELPAKEDVTFAEQVHALAKQLSNEHPELLGKKRKVLTTQLSRLYEMDVTPPSSSASSKSSSTSASSEAVRRESSVAGRRDSFVKLEPLHRSRVDSFVFKPSCGGMMMPLMVS